MKLNDLIPVKLFRYPSILIVSLILSILLAREAGGDIALNPANVPDPDSVKKIVELIKQNTNLKSNIYDFLARLALTNATEIRAVLKLEIPGENPPIMLELNKVENQLFICGITGRAGSPFQDGLLTDPIDYDRLVAILQEATSITLESVATTEELSEKGIQKLTNALTEVNPEMAELLNKSGQIINASGILQVVLNEDESKTYINTYLEGNTGITSTYSIVISKNATSAAIEVNINSQSANSTIPPLYFAVPKSDPRYDIISTSIK